MAFTDHKHIMERRDQVPPGPFNDLSELSLYEEFLVNSPDDIEYLYASVCRVRSRLDYLVKTYRSLSRSDLIDDNTAFMAADAASEIEKIIKEMDAR